MDPSGISNLSIVPVVISRTRTRCCERLSEDHSEHNQKSNKENFSFYKSIPARIGGGTMGRGCYSIGNVGPVFFVRRPGKLG